MKVSTEQESLSIQTLNFEVMSKSSLKIKKISSFAEMLNNGIKIGNLRKAVAVGDKVYVKVWWN